jgi:hypothetical protein
LIVASFLSGFLSAGIGIAGGVLPAALLSLSLPSTEAVALLAPIVLAGEVASAPFYRSAWRARHLVIVLPPLVVGTWFGTVFLARAPVVLIARAMAALVILIALLEVRKWNAPEPPTEGVRRGWLGSPLGGIVAGLAGGVTSAVAHAGGILLAPYLLAAGLAKEAFVGTVLVILALADTAKLATFWQAGLFTRSMAGPIAWALPFLLVGVVLGRQVNRRLSMRRFRQALACALLIVGVLLLLK